MTDEKKDELKCYKCRKVADNGRMEGKKFICRDCAGSKTVTENEKEKKKQWDAERKKEKEHVKKNPKCMCDLCKQERVT